MHKYNMRHITQIRCSIKFQINCTLDICSSSHAPLPLVRTDVLEIYHNNIVFGYINILRGICNLIINHALLYVNVLAFIICRTVFNLNLNAVKRKLDIVIDFSLILP